MGKLCAMPNCPSGHHADRTRRRKENKRQASVFRVPKHESMLQIWRKASGLDLSKDDVLCELHFSPDCIKKGETVVMHDGKVHISEFKRWILREGATPRKCVELLPLSRFHQVNAASMELSQINCDEHLKKRVDNVSQEIAAPDAMELPEMELHDSLEIACNVNWDGADPDSTEFSTMERHNTFETIFNVYQHDAAPEPNVFSDTEGGDIKMGTENETPLIEAPNRYVDNVPQLNISDLIAYFRTGRAVPEAWSWFTRKEGEIIFTEIDRATMKPRLYLFIHNDLSITFSTSDEQTTINLSGRIQSMQDVHNLFTSFQRTLICPGSGLQQQSRALNCKGMLGKQEYKRFVLAPRCEPCRTLRRNLQIRAKHRTTDASRYARLQHLANLKQRTCHRLKSTLSSLKSKVKVAIKACSAVDKTALERAIAKLPPTQQESVFACFNAASEKHANRKRYKRDWIYECLLMHIKSSKLYDHMRSRNILSLPSKNTLNQYIRNLNPCFGFQRSVFDCLRLKASRMEVGDKIGTLLVDEMSVSEAISLDRKSLKFYGFVDLGDHTPASLQDTRGDHALVFMYQPFRGPWVQVLGCFLSKNCAPSEILHKLILECLIQLSRSGFHAIVVTMDGAQWNRGVWTRFGIDESNLSCEHPCNSKQRLWMVSDFPHLWKNFRTGFLGPESLVTPSGMVRKAHFEEVLCQETYTKPNLKIAYALTPSHLNPKGYEKMNVLLAFQLFSQRVRVAMKAYMDDPNCHRLHDAAPTIDFLEKADNLIHAMMSRIPADALRLKDTCKNKKVAISGSH